MRKYATAALLCIALIACRQSETTSTKSGGAAAGGNQPSDMSNAKVHEVIDKAPQFVDHVMLGTVLSPDGTVSKEDDRIALGQPVYLTMWFRESPAGLQASAVWTTMEKKPISTERKAMNGAKVVTFSAGNKLKPGLYKVTGYWGGNVAIDRQFEIVGIEELKQTSKPSK